ncbi:MAG: dGTP triphosphohydrolase [Phycisphaerae bacterium]
MIFAREHPDPLAEVDAPLVVDRQRIVHAAAFRRLQYKAQVFIAANDDHFRTRLTHTLEVANLARRIAALIGASADLAEVVALAHDLGHPPFGHAGERALSSCLSDYGAFEHNAQSLRVVEFLEHPYPEFRGLNLTRVVRESLAKHATPFDHPGHHPLQDGLPAPIEGQVADLADRLAYALHDFQDGLYAGLITPLVVCDLALLREVDSAGAFGSGDAATCRAHLRPIVDRMQRRLLDDIAVETLRRMPTDRSAASADGRPVVRLSTDGQHLLSQLEALLRSELYSHPRVRDADQDCAAQLEAVFGAYVNRPNEMGPRYAARADQSGVHRVVADYVAGMTDRFCLSEYARLCRATR